jgi:hypothetical protein
MTLEDEVSGLDSSSQWRYKHYIEIHLVYLKLLALLDSLFGQQTIHEFCGHPLCKRTFLFINYIRL